ncbi:MAG: FtsL-like putative cell division protein [Cytophagaceae bacterium]
MSGNQPKSSQKEEKRSIFTMIEKKVRVDKMFDEGLPVKYIPYVLYTTVVLILYIGNTHYAERTVRQIDKTKTEVEDLRADYTTLKSDLMYASKQSEVAKKAASLGLEESSQPPYKIIVKESEY